MQRTVRRLYWLIIGLALGLTIPWLFVAPVYPAELSLGAGPMSGHTYNRKDCIRTGFGSVLSYERSLSEKLHWRPKINYGLSYYFLNFEKVDNLNNHSHGVESHVIGGFVKIYWRLTEEIQPFGALGAGGDFSSDGNRPVFIPSVGVDLWLDKHIALVPSAFAMIGEDGNYRGVLLSVKVPIEF